MPRAQSNPAVALKERSRVPPQGSNTFGRVAGRASAGGLFPRPHALALFLVPTLCPFFSSLRSAWGRVPWPLRGLFLFGEENLPRAANPREVGVAGSQGWTQERPHLRPHALALLLVLRSAWGRVPWPLRGLFLFGERTSRGLQTRGRLGLREVRVGRRSVRTSAPTLWPFFSSLRSAWGRVPWPLRGLFLFGEENLPRAANPREVGVAGGQGWTQERPHLRPHALALLLVLRSAWGRVPWPLRGLFLFGERTSRGLQTRGRLGLREVRVGRRSVRTSAPTRNVGVRGSVRGAACAPPEGQRSHRSRLGRAPPPVSAFAWPCQFL